MTKELHNTIKTTCPGARLLKVGKWDWIYFENKPSKEIRDAMKKAGGHFNGRRVCWQFSNGHHSQHSKASAKAVMLRYGVTEEE